MSETIIVHRIHFVEGKPCFKSLYKPWTRSLTANIFPSEGSHTQEKLPTTAARTCIPDKLNSYFPPAPSRSKLIILTGLFLRTRACRRTRKIRALFYQLIEILILQQIRHGI